MPPRKNKKKEIEVPPEPEPEPEPDPDAPFQRLIPGENQWDPPKLMIRPREQVQLSDKELGEEYTLVLNAQNPEAPHNIVRFSNKEKCFKHEAVVDQLMVHYSQEGHLLHTGSDEGRRQKEREDEEKTFNAKEAEKKKTAGAEAEDDPTATRNQFNFAERASQTLNRKLRERSTITEPPPSVEYAAQCTQWEMFDAYMEDIDRKKEQDAKGKKKDKDKEKPSKEKKGSDQNQEDEGKDSIVNSAAMAHASKILERMVNQNTFSDVTEDFKFWEDASDAFREEGTLLPLWKFTFDKAKKKHITCLRWNSEFNDLFAVGYGSYDFMKQSGGMLCLFSLKNPSWPEIHVTTPSGVMCMDWHPEHSSVLAVGLYDGTVAVYDVRDESMTPMYQSTVKTGKHTDPVWEVAWQPEDLAKNLNFYSISSDGRVTLWTLAKSNLEYSDLMKLKLEPSAMSKQASTDMDEEDSHLMGLAGGCCFDFSKLSQHLFLVGTEEGSIHKCSKAFTSDYLMTYSGHYMCIYTVRWNSFHKELFASCSADGTVKLWDNNTKSAVLSFDLNLQVGDLAWSPWSSTTFAACTADGKIHVFDLNENKKEAYCEQKVARRSKLTKVTFNPSAKTAVLLVGDDHGTIIALKPSPNLRWTAVTKAEAEEKAKAEAEAAASGPRRGAPKPKDDGESGEKKDPLVLEFEKMDKILDQAKKHQMIE